MNPLLRVAFSYEVATKPNEYAGLQDDPHQSWDAAVKAGRNYLAGRDLPIRAFLRSHSSSLNASQRLAFAWCAANPDLTLVLTAQKGPLIYHVQKRGEYVQIALPYHDHGGEKHWISRSGKTKVLINVD